MQLRPHSLHLSPMLPQTEIIFYTSQFETVISFLVAPQWPGDQNLKSLNDEHQSEEKDHTILD